MRAKAFLMASLLVSCAWGSHTAAWAEDISVTPVQNSGSEKPAERISLQSLKTLRDPFKRLGMDIPENHDEKTKTELESVPVSEFKMVGVLTGPYKTRALVRSPAGNVYTVSDGTRIGTQNGYVRKVLQDRIVVNEVLQDVLGERELVTSELKLTSKGMEKGVSSVQSILPNAASNSGAAKKAVGSEAHDNDGTKEGAGAEAAKPNEVKVGLPAASPVTSAPAQTAQTAPAPQAAQAAIGGNSYNLAVPAPVALPQSNGMQKTAGSK
jgi:Tfp pilus assembly protein PilP